MDIKEKTAIITGGSRGLGRNTALNLASRGVNIIFTYNSNKFEAEKTLQLIQEYGVNGAMLNLDTANTKLFATNESAVEKKPKLRLMIKRSSSVKPLGSFQRATSALILISLGIQWLAQAVKYLSQAQRYLNGTSWFRSARQLMICLSST